MSMDGGVSSHVVATVGRCGSWGGGQCGSPCTVALSPAVAAWLGLAAGRWAPAARRAAVSIRADLAGNAATCILLYNRLCHNMIYSIIV